jgi:cytochrome c peroxidase
MRQIVYLCVVGCSAFACTAASGNDESATAADPSRGRWREAEGCARGRTQGRRRCAAARPGHGIDDFQAQRAPDQRYRTSPLRDLFAHARGGFYHDGRFATLADVVAHDNTALKLGLTSPEAADLVAFLQSL